MKILCDIKRNNLIKKNNFIKQKILVFLCTFEEYSIFSITSSKFYNIYLEFSENYIFLISFKVFRIGSKTISKLLSHVVNLKLFLINEMTIFKICSTSIFIIITEFKMPKRNIFFLDFIDFIQ